MSPSRAEPGQTLSCSSGKWSNSPTYTYAWLKQKSGGAKEAIAGASGSTFTVATEDEGYSVWCKVTAKNSAGEATAESSTGATIPGKEPVLESGKPPQISGTLAAGQLLTCKEGGWTGSKPLSFAFKWYLNGTTEIAGAIASTYTVPSADEGQKLVCEVIATNSQGKGTARSASVSIAVKAPENTNPPVISPGKPEKGQLLTCSPGTWTGAPTVTNTSGGVTNPKERKQKLPRERTNTPSRKRTSEMRCAARSRPRTPAAPRVG